MFELISLHFFPGTMDLEHLKVNTLEFFSNTILLS